MPMAQVPAHLIEKIKLAGGDDGAVVGLTCPEIGFGAALMFSQEQYDPLEVQEIAEMVSRVVTAWHKRRVFLQARTETYKVTVN